ncbi:MAG: ribbon-helix-helix protein, CopG family [Alphaproteobacteria bacterium]|nr:ribbon-helix-helix protein, CopG family [Alphaproteobacteria bacterium]
MANLSIRNLDDKVVERLKKKAKDNGRSLEAELRELLKQAANRKSPEELLAIADRISAMTPDDVEQTDSTKIIREFRDR